MLCCVGLFGGMALGQSLGGPWTVIAPAAGFGIGFLADMKLMKGMHGGKPDKARERPVEPPDVQPVAAAPDKPAVPAYQVQDLGKT